MRSPERIPKILDLIEKCWNRYPDQRLCQLIHNAVACYDSKWHGKDQFYVEDEWLEKGLIKYLKP